MKKIILPLALLFSISLASAQSWQNRPLNTARVDFMGHASMMSAQYERLLLNRETWMLTVMVGAGFNAAGNFCPFGDCTVDRVDYMSVPHALALSYGLDRHFVEISAGGAALLGNTAHHYAFYPTIGYRFNPMESGKLQLRAYAGYPFYDGDGNDSDILFSPLGISVGIGF